MKQRQLQKKNNPRDTELTEKNCLGNRKFVIWPFLPIPYQFAMTNRLFLRPAVSVINYELKFRI